MAPVQTSQLEADLRGDLWNIEAELVSKGRSTARFDILGGAVEYDFEMGVVRCQDVSAPLAAVSKGDKKSVRLRILVDRGSLEVFGNDGQVAISKGFAPAASKTPLSLTAKGDATMVKRLRVHKLASIWGRSSPAFRTRG